VLGYRAGGAVVADTNRTAGAESMIEGYVGAPIGRSIWDFENGFALGGGVRSGPGRGTFSLEQRFSFRASLPKVAIVTGVYAAPVFLLGGPDMGGEAPFGLAFAVEPTIGSISHCTRHQLGFEVQAGLGPGRQPGAAQAGLTGVFSLRIYYDSFTVASSGPGPSYQEEPLNVNGCR
jgi:hypothetical protein